MAASTVAVKPLSDWDCEAIDQFTTRAGAAGGVAWDVLTHSQSIGPDIARIVGPEGKRRALPVDMDSEDMYGFLFDLITAAAEIGYVVGQIQTAGFEPTFSEAAKLRTVDVARAVAALVRVDVVEDGQTFEIDYRTKRDAAWQEASAA